MARLECAAIKGEVDGSNSARETIRQKQGEEVGEMTDDYRLKSDRRCRGFYKRDTRGSVPRFGGCEQLPPALQVH